ncbi:glycosyltransferase family 8 protein [Mucilaginibacter sp. RS28]|uniref:Glycosyltransferase family 8 protein n=1 Tax=Mucilaginibacter straminoryzae TaxID=2932774 RepID=A0A9X1X3C4_9SPHI|nr:glycosyltransferase family 8 protein [Mucilaginibacter straminoryzae]MCJ8210412.1 glycosyltransferase family 8 protein [Mucilaginibacter straminoryzae]
MTGTDKRLSVVYACDNNFAPLLAASIKSLEINSAGSLIDVYIIDDGISSSGIQKLKQSVTSSDVALKFYPVKEVVGKIKLPYFNNARLPVTTFFRLFVHTFIPEGTERVLYLDSDMIVLGNIRELWDIDLGDHIVAAVQDPGIKTLGCSWGGGVRNWEELGYHSEDLYLNAGLLLINYKKWVEFDVCNKALDAAVKYQKYIVYGDQYCLNVVLANRWLPLDPEWNHLVDNDQPGAKLLHYIGNKPIYTNYSYSEKYRDIFFDYLKKTAYRDFKMVSGFTRQVRMVKRFFRKIFG